MFGIEFTAEAIDDLASLRKYDQRRIISEIESRLTDQPQFETRHRKRLRPNELAEWELRVDTFRVFYDVVSVQTAELEGASSEHGEAVDGLVKIVAIGWKDGSKLFIHGEEFQI